MQQRKTTVGDDEKHDLTKYWPYVKKHSFYCNLVILACSFYGLTNAWHKSVYKELQPYMVKILNNMDECGPC